MKVLWATWFVVLVVFVGMAENAGANVVTERETTASCFGSELAGGLMANGERFDPGSKVVAHRWLPFGTAVLFRYGDREVLAFVADRGPHVGDREWDLSCGAMALLGLPPGVHRVLVS